jgi:hypothetical protein
MCAVVAGCIGLFAGYLQKSLQSGAQFPFPLQDFGQSASLPEGGT